MLAAGCLLSGGAGYRIALSWGADHQSGIDRTQVAALAQGALFTDVFETTVSRSLAGAPIFLAGLRLHPGRDRHSRVSPNGTLLWRVSTTGSNDIPDTALTAYKNAAASLARTDPSCQLPWTLLAGIGRVESDHGRYGGSQLATDGVARPPIIGLALDGHDGVRAIPDSDNGKWDHDSTWDHAVGPMQFLPSTWRAVARDGNGDGVEDPNNIFDAALGTAAYLCSGSGSVLTPTGMAAAILRYNHSDYYVALVMAFERGYRSGVFSIPSPPPPPGSDQAAAKPVKPDKPIKHPVRHPATHPSSHPTSHPTSHPSTGPIIGPTTGPTQPPTNTPAPPTPTPTALPAVPAPSPNSLGAATPS
ncbi:MAG: hypothetical protein JWR35_2171 [Marmoricola sp.]|nr:hypothetical protein [Marmoricola sp.]